MISRTHSYKDVDLLNAIFECNEQSKEEELQAQSKLIHYLLEAERKKHKASNEKSSKRTKFKIFSLFSKKKPVSDFLESKVSDEFLKRMIYCLGNEIVESFLYIHNHYDFISYEMVFEHFDYEENKKSKEEYDQKEIEEKNNVKEKMQSLK